MHPKITPDHLGRGAVVYIRQSTLGQVTEHTESQRRQYALAESARSIGFASVAVIDDDLGRSGVWLGGAPWLSEAGRLRVFWVNRRRSALKRRGLLGTDVTGTTCSGLRIRDCSYPSPAATTAACAGSDGARRHTTRC
jgi:hypothetical protein